MHIVFKNTEDLIEELKNVPTNAIVLVDELVEEDGTFVINEVIYQGTKGD